MNDNDKLKLEKIISIRMKDVLTEVYNELKYNKNILEEDYSLYARDRLVSEINNIAFLCKNKYQLDNTLNLYESVSWDSLVNNVKGIASKTLTSTKSGLQSIGSNTLNLISNYKKSTVFASVLGYIAYTNWIQKTNKDKLNDLIDSLKIKFDGPDTKSLNFNIKWDSTTSKYMFEFNKSELGNAYNSNLPKIIKDKINISPSNTNIISFDSNELLELRKQMENGAKDILKMNINIPTNIDLNTTFKVTKIDDAFTMNISDANNLNKIMDLYNINPKYHITIPEGKVNESISSINDVRFNEIQNELSKNGIRITSEQIRDASPTILNTLNLLLENPLIRYAFILAAGAFAVLKIRKFLDEKDLYFINDFQKDVDDIAIRLIKFGHSKEVYEVRTNITYAKIENQKKIDLVSDINMRIKLSVGMNLEYYSMYVAGLFSIFIAYVDSKYPEVIDNNNTIDGILHQCPDDPYKTIFKDLWQNYKIFIKKTLENFSPDQIPKWIIIVEDILGKYKDVKFKQSKISMKSPNTFNSDNNDKSQRYSSASKDNFKPNNFNVRTDAKPYEKKYDKTEKSDYKKPEYKKPTYNSAK